MSADLLVVLVLGVVAWKIVAVVLSGWAWVLVAVMALSLLGGVAVPGAVVVLAVAGWFGSQCVSRIKHRRWRSSGLRVASRAVGAMRAARP